MRIAFLKFALVYCILFFWRFHVFAQRQTAFQGLPFITNYEASDYKGGIQNWDIIQDNIGRIYVANNLGLLEFNGKDWIRYGLNNTKVRSAAWSSSGKIYVGSQADFGFLSSDLVGRLRYISLADSLPKELRDFDDTWKVFEIEDAVYFCTFRRIYLYENGKLQVLEPNQRLDISFKINNQILTQIVGGGLHQVTKEGYELVRNGDFFADKRISNILPFDQNQWLITTVGQGAFRYDGDIYPFLISGDFWKNEFLINYSVRLKNGNIALGTQNAGLFVVDQQGQLVIHLTKDTGLMDLTINYIYEDGDNGLWLAMNNGIARVDLNSPFTTIDDRMGLLGTGYAALKVQDRMYLGTNNGLFVKQNGGIQLVPGTEGQVYAVQEIQGKVILGHHKGTFSVSNNQIKRLSGEEGAWLLKAHPSKEGYYIQGTYTGLSLFQWKDGQLGFVRKLEGFDESSRIMEFEGETLWVAHGYKGLFKIKLDDGLTRVLDSKLYNSAQGFPNDVLINVYKVNNRLMFTANGGFYTYDAPSDRFIPWNEFNDLFGYGTVVADIESDDLGNIYFIEQSQLGLIKKGTNNKKSLHTSPFQKVHRLWNDDLPNVVVLDNQNILIGGKEGFIHYNPLKDIPSENHPNVFFKEIINKGKITDTLYLGHDQAVLEQRDASFDYSQNSFSFDFASIHFESSNEIQYQFFLENYDSDWSNWGLESKKEYTNLKEGDYVFHVKAKTLFGKETAPVKFSFKILPPIYKSSWAYFVYAIGFVSLLFVGFSWLDKRHKRQTQRLEIEKKRALKRKDDEIESITQRSEEEIMQLKNVQLQSEIDFKNQELTSSAMHLIQKNKLLHDIKNSLKNLTEEDKNQQLTSQFKRLIKSIDKDLDGAEEWSRFSENFDQVHGNFITRLKEKYPELTPQEIKFSAYLRMNLNTKEIANLLGISVRGVEIGRYRVRKKLALTRQENLNDFLLRF